MRKLEPWLFFLLVCFLPSQLSYHYWPALVSSLPIRSDYLAITVYFSDLLAVFLLFVHLLIHRPQINFYRRISPRTIVLIFLLVLNTCFSVSPLLTLYHYLQILGYYLLFSYYFRTPFGRKLFLSGLLVSLSWVSLVGISQFFFSHSLGGLFWWLGERPLDLSAPLIAKVNLGFFGPHLRVYATFPHPNALAGFMLIALIFVDQIRNQLAAFPRLLTRLIFSLSLLCLFFTFSYSAVAAGINYLIYQQLRHHFSRFKTWLVLGSVAGLEVLVYSLLRPASFLLRLSHIPVAVSGFFSHPLLGTGFGAYLLGVSDPILTLGSFYQPVHNLYLLLLVELGLPLFLLFIVSLIKHLRFLSPPLLTIMFLGLFDHYWLTSHANIIFVVILITYYLSLTKTHVRS
jgi:hypothetical protein